MEDVLGLELLSWGNHKFLIRLLHNRGMMRHNIVYRYPRNPGVSWWSSGGRTLRFHPCSLSSIPGLGAEIPSQATACLQPKKKKERNANANLLFPFLRLIDSLFPNLLISGF